MITNKIKNRTAKEEFQHVECFDCWLFPLIPSISPIQNHKLWEQFDLQEILPIKYFDSSDLDEKFLVDEEELATRSQSKAQV